MSDDNTMNPGTDMGGDSENSDGSDDTASASDDFEETTSSDSPAEETGDM